MLNQEYNLSLSDLKHIDESIAQTTLHLEQIAIEKRRLENDKTLVCIKFFSFVAILIVFYDMSI